MLILLQLSEGLLHALAEESGRASPLGGQHSQGDQGGVGGGVQWYGLLGHFVRCITQIHRMDAFCLLTWM